MHRSFTVAIYPFSFIHEYCNHIYYFDSYNISENKVESNGTGSIGGGIFSARSPLEMRKSEVRGNRAYLGAGVNINADTRVLFAQSI